MDHGRPSIRELWFPFALRIIHTGKWAKLSKGAKAVYPAIAAFADFQLAVCFPSLSTIARCAGVGRYTVQKAITELIKAGLLTRESGDATRSNRYRLVEWPRLGASPPQASAEPTPGFAESLPLGSERAPNNNQETTAIRTTTTNDRKGRGPSFLEGGDKEDLVGLLASELGLRAVGVRQLEDLIDTHSPDTVREACEEAVSQGKPSLKYLRGILRNWARTGRPDRKTRRETAGTRRGASRVKETERRTEDRCLQARREEAFELAQTKLGECTPDELARWTRDATDEAERARIPGALRDGYVQSRLLQRVAEKYGIEGL